MDLKCPLRRDHSSRDDRNSNFGKCIEHECAWWVKQDRACAINSLGVTAFFIHDEIPKEKSNIDEV